MIGASIMLLSLLTNNFYIILGVLCIYGFAIANLVPIVIRQAVKQSNESIPMTVTNLITIIRKILKIAILELLQHFQISKI